MRAVPRLSIVDPGISLTTGENHGKPQSGYPKGARLKSAERDSFSRLAGLLAPAALRFRVRRRGQPSVSVSICRVAALGSSPHQLTLSRNWQSGL